MKKSILLLFVAVLLCGCSQTKGKTEANTKQEDTVKVTAKIPHFGICIGDDYDKSVAKLKKTFGNKIVVTKGKTFTMFLGAKYDKTQYAVINITPDTEESTKPRKVSIISYAYNCDEYGTLCDAIQKIKKKYSLPEEIVYKADFTSVKYLEDGTKIMVYGGEQKNACVLWVGFHAVKPMNLE